MFGILIVLVGFGIPELLREAKINKVHSLGLGPNAHNKIAGFEITMDRIARVNELKAMNLGKG